MHSLHHFCSTGMYTDVYRQAVCFRLMTGGEQLASTEVLAGQLLFAFGADMLLVLFISTMFLSDACLQQNGESFSVLAALQ